MHPEEDEITLKSNALSLNDWYVKLEKVRNFHSAIAVVKKCTLLSDLLIGLILGIVCANAKERED
ncbi:hypothetical protein NBRC116591_36790 [Sessilibacter corallicola]|uniref:Uncharacterized protein n=1 Tax=Sessilibacter corallicola TaxID=2904075 RepID=A0ABQ0ADY6_9GAMM